MPGRRRPAPSRGPRRRARRSPPSTPSGCAPRVRHRPSEWPASDGKLDVADVETQRLGEADADLQILVQALEVARAHRAADHRAFLRTPERVLDEDREQTVGGVDELAFRLLRG